MKRKTLSWFLALLMVLGLLPVQAATEPTEADLKTPPTISNLEIHDDGGNNIWLEVTVYTPENVLNAIDYFENHERGYNQAGYIGQIDLQYSIDGGEWQETMISVAWRYYEDADETPRWNGIHETYYLDELHGDSEVRARARYDGADAYGNPRYSDWSNMLTLNEKVDFTASSWAKAELAKADELGLIPDCLKGQDLTKPINRQEFAAVSVKVYESLTGKKAQSAAENPFGDTADPEVLKAFALGITNGTGTGKDGKATYSPTVLLNRETLATMLTRVYKKTAIQGWTLETDASYSDAFRAMFAMPEPFADDASISGWAKDSVYFLAAKGIVGGVGDNKFAPRAITDAEQAVGYAQATREAALVIAVRMVTNLE